MNQHAKVIARHAHALADAVAILLLEEQRGEQLAVAGLERIDRAADGELPLLDQELRLGAGRRRIRPVVGFAIWKKDVKRTRGSTPSRSSSRRRPTRS